MPALASEGWQELGTAQKVKTKGWRRRNLLRPCVCVSRTGQSVGDPGKLKGTVGLGLHLHPQLRVSARVCVLASFDVTYMASEVECHA